ncbi:hypothetical protein PHMEG_00014049 [Phytophthora megakarya]|uniref:Chromo domain-containing protein n=1 Tax=Phytophthora megakarya TaxID=4795 RepID=A0A225W5A3_9STRA|nr:hypothetical protein PHMEG_00014049 [Phytophthora megakarya]
MLDIKEFDCRTSAAGRRGHNLALVWRGLKKIFIALNDYTFEVQDIVVPFEVLICHAFRLQIYRKADLGREEELQEQETYGERGHLVEALRKCRLSPVTQPWEVKVKWFSLDKIEASWKPAEAIREDVPVLFQGYIDANISDPDCCSMTSAFEQSSATPLTSASARPLTHPRHC